MVRLLSRFRRKKDLLELETNDYEPTGEDAESEEPEKEPGSKVKEIRDSGKKLAERPNFELQMSYIFFLNALILSMLAGMILKLSAVAEVYRERVAILTPQYLSLVDSGTIIGVGFLIYGLINVFLAAYLLNESKWR